MSKSTRLTKKQYNLLKKGVSCECENTYLDENFVCKTCGKPHLKAIKMYGSLTRRAADGAYCACKRPYINKPMTTAFICAFCGKPPRR